MKVNRGNFYLSSHGFSVKWFTGDMKVGKKATFQFKFPKLCLLGQKHWDMRCETTTVFTLLYPLSFCQIHLHEIHKHDV